MKSFWKEFFHRGLLCAWGGPVILAIIYGISDAMGTMDLLRPGQVCLQILTISLLAFVAAGMTSIYQMEQLPLPIMILLHGGALYVAYIVTYLINGWLHTGLVPILVFTGIFIGCYGAIWTVIYSITRAKAKKLNEKLKER